MKIVTLKERKMEENNVVVEETAVEEQAERKPRRKVVTKVMRHKELCKELNRIYEKKNNDYGDSFGDTYKKLGLSSALVRISDKYNRLMSLGSGKKQMVNDESIRDTLMDLSNYALMTIMEIDRENYLKDKKDAKN